MRSDELIEEIKAISRQYEAEVDRAHKPWPKAIRDRVVELLEDGINANRISKATGISYHTVLKWRELKGRPRGKVQSQFKELSVASVVTDNVDVVAVAQKVVAATTTQKLAIALGGQVQRPDVPVPITTPDGFKIELPCVDAAVDFIIKLRRIGA